jgi:hypothetical protein
VGVHQNLTHAVHPDPLSGAHCWLQKATNVRKADPGDRHGDVWVDTQRSMAVYREWLALTRSAVDVSPDGTRRPPGSSARSSRMDGRTQPEVDRNSTRMTRIGRICADPIRHYPPNPCHPRAISTF